jgi:glycosyltransferase involved in cell wall biosynthesis
VPDQQPTICQLLHGLPIGGAEVLADRFVRCLSDRYRFVIACLDQVGTLGEGLTADGYRVNLLGRKPGLDLGCARRLARFLREEKVDLIHAHQYTPFFYALTSRGLFGRVPIVFTEHGRWHPDYPRKKRMLFNRLMIGKRDQFLGVGEAVRQALIQNEGLPKDRVEVVYNGINLAPFEHPPTDRSRVRSELGLSPEGFLVIQVARLDGLKDHPTAIRTMQHVARAMPRAKLILVGEGPERAGIEALIRELKLEGHVKLLGSRRDVPRLLFAADVFLLTSISEGIPLTIIEGMAAGLPVVSTDVGGVGEILGDPPVGFLAPAGDDRKLAEGILQLASNPEIHRAWSEDGRQRAFEIFSEQTMHARYAEIFDSVIARSPSPSSAALTP